VSLRWGRIPCAKDDTLAAEIGEALKRNDSGKQVHVEKEYAYSRQVVHLILWKHHVRNESGFALGVSSR
jgi:hypothetical protein